METKQDTITPAILDIRKFRETLAEFLAEHHEMPHQITEHCIRNGWNDGVAFDIQHAMFELGHALGALMLWERDVELTSAQLRKIDGIESGMKA